MIHDIATELRARLVVAGCPVKVVTGPEETRPTSWANERIVLEFSGSDSVSLPPTQSRNPKARFVQRCGAKATIYTQSTSSGALPCEHQARALLILDQVLVGLEYVFRVRRNGWSVTGGRFSEVEDSRESPRKAGAVYEMDFAFERGVFAWNWSQALAPEVTLPSGSAVNSTHVYLTNGSSSAEPEQSCGPPPPEDP